MNSNNEKDDKVIHSFTEIGKAIIHNTIITGRNKNKSVGAIFPISREKKLLFEKWYFLRRFGEIVKFWSWGKFRH